MIKSVTMYIFKTLHNQYKEVKICYDLSSLRLRRYAFFAILLGFLIALFEYLFIYSLQYFFSLKKLIEAPELLPYFQLDLTLKSALILVITMGVTKYVFEGFRVFVSRATQNIFIRDVRTRILSISLKNGSNVSISNALSLFSDDAKRGADAIFNLISVFITLSTLVLLFAIASKLAFKELILSCALLAIALLPLRFINKRSKLIGRKLTLLWSEISSHLTNNIRNNFYIRLYGQTKKEELEGEKKLDLNLSDHLRAYGIISLNQVLPSLTGFIVIIAITYSSKESGDKSSYLISFFYIFLRIAQGVSSLNSFFNNYKINMQSIHSLNNWISKVEKNNAAQMRTNTLEEEIKTLSFSDVSFSYSDKDVLKNLSFDVKNGVPLIVSGESGSGKSTLITVLLGLQEQINGKVLVNGHSLYGEKNLSLHDKIAYVGPQPYLIPGTIRENLLYGTSANLSDEKIYNALEMACIKERVQSLPNNLDQTINEHADILSTGEKQRIMIARAILRDAELYIFDEFTSNLDHNIQARVLENLTSIFKSKFSVIISHREELKSIEHQSLKLEAN
jgi:ABC-type multidrug transport system fused ATPase/permease subunit